MTVHAQTIRRPFVPRLAALLLALMLAMAPPAAAAELEAGLYQSRDAQASCRLAVLPDGSYSLHMWQGGANQPHEHGFALAGRLLAAADGRLVGQFQSLPQSCCPLHGRLELLPRNAESFRVVAFTPTDGQGQWATAEDTVFGLVARPAEGQAILRLGGQWRLRYWHTDLLPGNQPSDLVDGQIDLRADGDALRGQWSGQPGQILLSPAPGGARLEYRDQAAGFSLEADLQEQSGGLALCGPFRSTLGAGQLQLTRLGLPADPPGAAEARLSRGGRWDGLWVDPRTGGDFYQISATATGLGLTAYGGSPRNPRYLTRGQLTAGQGGAFSGPAQDADGHCCGNQGRVTIRPLADDALEVTALWWPKGAPQPDPSRGQTFVIQRAKDDASGGQAAVKRQGWPQVIAARPGLPSTESGALRARFVWRMDGQPRDNTIFSQGGYGRDMDLFIDRAGHLAARVATTAGALELRSQNAVAPNTANEAWLIYQHGGQASLWLDGRRQDAVDMTAPWAGSNSPYIVGGSRWPGREFRGEIVSLELWDQAQDVNHPAPPAFSLSPDGPPPADAPAQAAPHRRPATLTLTRWRHPSLLAHAYASDPAAGAALQAQGFLPDGPICRLWAQGGPGMVELWAHVHQRTGQVVVSASRHSPPGFVERGSLGHASAQASRGLKPLLSLAMPAGDDSANRADQLCTTRAELTEALQAWGYAEPAVLAHVEPLDEGQPAPPFDQGWDGAWRGEGWGRFLLQRQGGHLVMFWYYSTRQGPHYFGRYALEPGGRAAEGLAVGKPGPEATYYRHRLELIADGPEGPRIKLTAWRLAAPMDDGRLVRFKKPAPTVTELRKVAQNAPRADADLLRETAEKLDPDQMLREALTRAQGQNRLVER